MKKFRVPKEFLKAAQGEAFALGELQNIFKNAPERDPRKPWMARALLASGKFAPAEAYQKKLSEAVSKIVQKGGTLLKPSNLRTGRDGYKWGPEAGNSDILKAMGVSPSVLKKMGLSPSDSVAERWYSSDDPQFPGWIRSGDVLLPLSYLIDSNALEVLGKDHVKCYGEAIGMVMKELDSAEPLSWQVHIGIEEGYEVQKMPEGTGLFMSVNEPASEADRKALIHNVRELLSDKDPRVIRLFKPKEGIETPPLLDDGIDALIHKLLVSIKNNMTVAELVEFLLLEGINVVDLAGFGLRDDGRMDEAKSLVHIFRPAPGERIVTRQAKPHALFGHVAGSGKNAVGWFKEFKGTATGARYDTTPTGDQTWGLADNLLGKFPRKGKVTTPKVKEALEAVKESGSWRKLLPKDYAPKGDASPVRLGEGVTKCRLHDEEQYSALKLEMEPGTAVRLERHGRHSALASVKGTIRVKNSKGEVLLERVGLEGGWDGSASTSDEAVVLASAGDIIIESIGKEKAVVYDAIRPVPGVKLPEPKVP